VIKAENKGMIMADVEKSIRNGREFLKSNWKKLDAITSDQMKGIEVPPGQKEYGEGRKIIDLVQVDKITVGRKPLLEVIRSRRSRRKYTSELLTLEELSFLLFAVQGVRKMQGEKAFRTVPSGGCRHSFETYLFVSRIEGLEEGLYRFVPFSNQLCQISREPDLKQRLNMALMGQNWECGVTFVWTTVPYRTEWRYSVVSHKIIAMDAGHVCQNLYLACEAIGCGTCAIGAYDQRMLDDVLNVDGVDEFAIYAAPVGKV
jgi:SagB-type dehydrogenase family enzyme